MGYDYLYHEDGNIDDGAIDRGNFREVKDERHRLCLYQSQQKGKGYKLAETKGVSITVFRSTLGNRHLTSESGEGEDYADLTAGYLLQEMKKDPTVVGITAEYTTRYLALHRSATRRQGGGSSIWAFAERASCCHENCHCCGGGKPLFGSTAPLSASALRPVVPGSLHQQ